MSNEDRRQHGLAVIIAAYERLPGVETRDDGAPLVQVVTLYEPPCESAPNIDPTLARSINDLRRRSAFGPRLGGF